MINTASYPTRPQYSCLCITDI